MDIVWYVEDRSNLIFVKTVHIADQIFHKTTGIVCSWFWALCFCFADALCDPKVIWINVQSHFMQAFAVLYVQ